ATVRPHAVPELDAVRQRDGHSNDFAEVPLDDGEVLVVKRGRFDWSRARFDTSRIASRIIRSATDVTVPEPLPVPGELDARPLEAYWWIDHPTLNQLWPALDPDERDSALRSWGELIARLHTVRLSGFGDLSLPNAQRPSVERFV